jgi:hypothetical protein
VGSSRLIADDFVADRAPVVEAVGGADPGDVVDVDSAVDQRAGDRYGGDRDEARLGQLGGPVVVGDGLDDRIGQTPPREQVGAELGVADAALFELWSPWGSSRRATPATISCSSSVSSAPA